MTYTSAPAPTWSPGSARVAADGRTLVMGLSIGIVIVPAPDLRHLVLPLLLIGQGPGEQRFVKAGRRQCELHLSAEVADGMKSVAGWNGLGA